MPENENGRRVHLFLGCAAGSCCPAHKFVDKPLGVEVVAAELHRPGRMSADDLDTDVARVRGNILGINTRLPVISLPVRKSSAVGG